MPQPSALGTEEPRVAEEVFVEVHTLPKPWGEGLAAFVAGMQRRLRYPADSRTWPSKEEALKRAYSGLHRKAEQSEWIVRAGRGWRSTPVALAFVQGHPLTPGELRTQDLHDIALRDCLRSTLHTLESPSVGASALDPAGVRESWAKVPPHSMFRDLQYHFRLMGITGEENPMTLLTELGELRLSCNVARKSLHAKGQAVLRKARPEWDGKPPLSLGPLMALETFLDEHSRDPPRAEARFASPAVANDEVRVGGSFTLFVGLGALQALPDVTRTWTQARTNAIRTLSKPNSSLRDNESKFWLSVSRSQAGLRKALTYPHYPGLCQFRRRAQERRLR